MPEGNHSRHDGSDDPIKELKSHDLDIILADIDEDKYRIKKGN